MKRVLVTEPMHDTGFALLRARDDIDAVFAEDMTPETLARLIPGVHGIAVRGAFLTAELLTLASDLQVVSRHGVGCDRIDVGHLTSRGIPMAIAAGANAQSVAEHTMALALSVARHQPALDDAVRDCDFDARNRLLATDLSGATMLIIGFGRIGRKVAPLARAFGMDVTVVDIKLDRELAAQMGCRAVEDFRPELTSADFVSLHVPLDDSTRHMLSKSEFEMMKTGSILINCARGGIVDEVAMMAALDAGQLRGAGLDVLSTEPPPPDDPMLTSLLARSDVILAPHAGASSFGAKIEMSRMAIQNLLDAFDGKLDPDCVFNLEGLNAP